MRAGVLVLGPGVFEALMLKVRLCVHEHFYERRVSHDHWIPKAATFPVALTAALGRALVGEGEGGTKEQSQPRVSWQGQEDVTGASWLE